MNTTNNTEYSSRFRKSQTDVYINNTFNVNRYIESKHLNIDKLTSFQNRNESQIQDTNTISDNQDRNDRND